MSNLFADTSEIVISRDGVDLFARVGGKGPPLLLIHGFPQTHAMWHRVQPALAERFTCIMPDLRGYGRSSCPPNDPENRAYSKREMALDMLALMRELGHERCMVVGHDRGARVAYRMALDHPDVVVRLAVLDIVPTFDMWENMGLRLGIKAYHWLMLAQPHPLPEMLIGPSAAEWLDYTIASWSKKKTLADFDPAAMAEYRASFVRPDWLSGSCSDYRAGASFDLEADRADRQASRRIACPTLAIWGDAGLPGQAGTPLDAWKVWCVDVKGHRVDAGHFVAEENPQATLAALLPFLADDAR